MSAAAATKLTVQTNQSTYSVGLNTIIVSGNVTPPPHETNTWVAVSILSPSGAMVDANQFEVNPTTGAFNGTFVTGGPTYTGPGAYTVNADYESINATAGFKYGNSSLSDQTTTSTNTTSSETIASTSTLTPTSSSTTSSQTSTTPTATSTVSSNSTTSTSVETLSSTSHSTTSSSSSAALEIGPVTLVIVVALAVLTFAVLVRIRRRSVS